MKLFFLFLSVLVSFASPLQQRSDGLEIEYDKFRDSTRANIRDSDAINVKGAKVVHFTPYYRYGGKTPSKFIEPAITIDFVEKLPRDAASGLELRLLIDGESDGPYYCEKINSRATDEGEARYYSVSIGADRIVEQIAKAKRVEGQLGVVEFELSSSTIAQITALYNRMPKKPAGLAMSYIDNLGLTQVDISSPDAIRVKNVKYLLFRPFYLFPGKVQTTIHSKEIIIQFVTDLHIRSDEKFDLKLVCDGNLLGSFSTKKLRTDPGTIGDLQNYAVSKDAETIIGSIAKAKSVKATLGEIEFELSPETISQIRLLNQRMQKQ